MYKWFALLIPTLYSITCKKKNLRNLSLIIYMIFNLYLYIYNEIKLRLVDTHVS